MFDHFSQFSKKWPFLATFGKIAISQPKRIQIKKNRSRQNQQRLSYKIGPKNRISKNVMEICGDGNSNPKLIYYKKTRIDQNKKFKQQLNHQNQILILSESDFNGCSKKFV